MGTAGADLHSLLLPKAQRLREVACALTMVTVVVINRWKPVAIIMFNVYYSYSTLQ